MKIAKSKFFKRAVSLLIKKGYSTSGAKGAVYKYINYGHSQELPLFEGWIALSNRPPRGKRVKQELVPKNLVEKLTEPQPFIAGLSELARTILRTKAHKEGKTIYQLCAQIVNEKCERILEEIL